jgi:hypothetical protein
MAWSPGAWTLGPITVFDTETTGAGAGDRVVSLGAVRLDAALEPEATLHLAFSPGIPCHWGAIRVHGMSDAFLACHPPFAEHAGEVAAFFGGHPAAAHNFAFDRRMLGSEFGRLGLELPWSGGFCTMQGLAPCLSRRAGGPLPAPPPPAASGGRRRCMARWRMPGSPCNCCGGCTGCRRCRCACTASQTDRERRSPDDRSTDAAARAEAFAALHREGCFVLPNAWDAGSARLLASLGPQALATTSAGVAWTLGRRDGAISKAEALANARAILAETSLPVSADLEDGYGSTPEACAATVRAAIEAGLAGCTIEDTTGDPAAPVHGFDAAVARIRAAVAAAREKGRPFVLTARAENFLHGRPDLDDTLRRLTAFAEAGRTASTPPACPIWLPSARSCRRSRPAPSMCCSARAAGWCRWRCWPRRACGASASAAPSPAPPMRRRWSSAGR